MSLRFKDLETRYEDWGGWSTCQSNSAECYAIGTKTRTRSCVSRKSTSTPKDKKYCVGPLIQKDWCRVPCYGKLLGNFCEDIYFVNS